uniref:Uncharacterized protein n=1 Tax=Meloidogyne enterolobii TaxID=390850 RepID=A0A6V7VB96_MELEN|nr:unnamed protein product [Meloidogyne enterolobii]
MAEYYTGFAAPLKLEFFSFSSQSKSQRLQTLVRFRACSRLQNRPDNNS